ncbi:hypothetical protein VP1G_05848 [Cytospora mali]|uniref:CFEM domain-containing protein n=1 Tax=Cytospora mali TaxID=578113 RepID=A0A194V3Q9_CYTMA|nr:hypothetical protein VP1G_05848 [Valsa mali var. pyri (nom. inval.)]
MQFKTIAISAFIGLAAATSSTDVSSLTNELPSCSLLCLVSGATAAGCGATDYTCQCNNQAAITSNATTCLTSSCSASDIGTTKSVSSQICEAITGSNSSSSQTASNSTASVKSSTSSTASSSSSTSTTADSSVGSRPELFGFGLAAIAGLTGLMVVV